MMNPVFLNQTNTGYFDLNQDHNHQDQQQRVPENSPYYPSSITASSNSNLHFEQGLGISADHRMSDQSLTFDQLEEGSKSLFVSPSYGAQMTSAGNYGSDNHEIFIFREQEDQETKNENSSGGIATDNGSSLRWMSSKMRILRKMMNSNNIKTCPRNGSTIISASNKNSDHVLQLAKNSHEHNDNNNGIRVCSDCNTTKTPLWRSGPQGPKTLCNACGIRQRKARKAAVEAAATVVATNSSNEASSSTSTKTSAIKLKINKEKNKSRATSKTCVSQNINKKQTPSNKEQDNGQLVDSDHNGSSTGSRSKRQMIFEEFAVNLLSKNAAFHRTFPQDEEEGALLLMALSYGLIES